MALIGAARVLHGGTYNTQSIAMAATLATLREVRSGRPYEAINLAGGQLISGLRAAFAEHGLPAVVVGYPAVFHVRFGGPATDYRIRTAGRPRQATPTSPSDWSPTAFGSCRAAPGLSPPHTVPSRSRPHWQRSERCCRRWRIRREDHRCPRHPGHGAAGQTDPVVLRGGDVDHPHHRRADHRRGADRYRGDQGRRRGRDSCCAASGLVHRTGSARGLPGSPAGSASSG